MRIQYRRNTASALGPASALGAALFTKTAAPTQQYTTALPTLGLQAAIVNHLKTSYAGTVGAKSYIGVIVAYNSVPKFGSPCDGKPVPSVGGFLPYADGGLSKLAAL